MNREIGIYVCIICDDITMGMLGCPRRITIRDAFVCGIRTRDSTDNTATSCLNRAELIAVADSDGSGFASDDSTCQVANLTSAITITHGIGTPAISAG